MADEMDKELVRIEVEQAFQDIITFPLQVGDEIYEAFSIHKLPVKYMLEFVDMDERNKVPVLLDFLKLCLVNPNDYEKVLELNGEEVMELIEQWMTRSEQAKKLEKARKLEKRNQPQLEDNATPEWDYDEDE